MGSGTGIFILYGAVFACMGLLISWAATACNNPIFAEIVPPHLRTLVYAFDRCLEGALSAIGRCWSNRENMSFSRPVLSAVLIIVSKC